MAIKAYTIISENYLPQAKTLADNFIQLHPDIEFYICLFGEKENNDFLEIKSDLFSGYKYILSNELNQGDYTTMRNQYDNFSMACALKPYFAEFILEKEQPNGLIYLDADLYFFSPLTDIQELLNNNEQQSSIILTSHNILIKEFDQEIERNISFLTYGTFNAGFFAIKNNQYSKQFIDWWKRMLNENCNVDLKRGLYCDQTWLNLVPTLFTDSLYILKHLGYNVAYWNIDAERRVSINLKNEYIINNKDLLVFYHYARFRYFDTENIIPNVSFNQVLNGNIIQDLYSRYRELLKINSFETFQRDIDIIQESNAEKESKIIQLKNKIKWKVIRIIQKI